MPLKTEQLRKDALALPLVERAALAEALLSSLDRPDPRIDALWAQEAEDRLAAFDGGEMDAIPAEDVFTELEHP
jgi:putative addiction module component (TIGR02574 family)